MDASDGELKARLDGAGGGLLLVAALHGALGTLAGEALTGEALSALARHVYVCVGGGTVSVARCIVRSRGRRMGSCLFFRAVFRISKLYGQNRR